eukprot:7805377-Pyramimonas_sp.AAC.2
MGPPLPVTARMHTTPQRPVPFSLHPASSSSHSPPLSPWALLTILAGPFRTHLMRYKGTVYEVSGAPGTLGILVVCFYRFARVVVKRRWAGG